MMIPSPLLASLRVSWVPVIFVVAHLVGGSQITIGFTEDEEYTPGAASTNGAWWGPANEFMVDPGGVGSVSLRDELAWRTMWLKELLDPEKEVYQIGIDFRFSRDAVQASGTFIGVKITNKLGHKLTAVVKRLKSGDNYKVKFSGKFGTTRVIKGSKKIAESSLGFKDTEDKDSELLRLEMQLKRDSIAASSWQLLCQIVNIETSSTVAIMETKIDSSLSFSTEKLRPSFQAGDKGSKTGIYQRVVEGFMASAYSVGSTNRKPNIITILMDDISTHNMGCYGNPRAQDLTPRIDQLLQTSGLKFLNGWATPMCMSSRAMLMGGQYGNKNSVYDNVIRKPDRGSYPSRHTMLPRKLQENGYSTFHAGKWHLASNPEDPDWGFDSYIAYGSLGPSYPAAWRDLYEGF